MHNFLQNRSKYNQLFLFLFFYSVTLSGMEVVSTKKRESGKREHSVTSNRRAHTPDQLIQIFSPKQAFKTGTPWSRLVPKSIMITPDSKGVILSEYGAVRHCFFDSKEDIGPKVIIEHCHAKKCFPLVTMAQKKDESLVVMSVANYTNSENKRIAEYVVFCNDFARRQKLDSSVQAISSDSYGKMLAIAGSHIVKVVDLETYKSAEAAFSFFHNDDNWIVDVAMNPEGKWLVAAGNQKGQIQWFSIVKENGCIMLNSLKQIIVDDIIENIYYPNRDELLYVDCKKRVKSIAMNDMLTSNNEHVKTADTFDFDKLLEGEKFAVDQAMRTKVCCVKHTKQRILESEKFVVDQAVLTKVCSVEYNKQHEDVTSTIEVWRKNNSEDMEIIACEIPLLQERYNYITDAGLSEFGTGHLLHAAVGRNHVVALATDGSLRVWNAPGKYIEAKKTQEVEEKIESDSVAHIKETKTKRGRSGSGRDNKNSLCGSDGGEGEKKKPSPRDRGKHNLVSSDEGEGEKKKPSPRDLIQMFKSSGSKDLSPTRSHKGSDETRSLKGNEEK